VKGRKGWDKHKLPKPSLLSDCVTFVCAGFGILLQVYIVRMIKLKPVADGEEPALCIELADCKNLRNSNNFLKRLRCTKWLYKCSPWNRDGKMDNLAVGLWSSPGILRHFNCGFSAYVF